MEKENPDVFLAETACLDYHHPAVQAYAEPFRKLVSDKEKAVAVYREVRDGFLYDPYHLDLRPRALKASRITGQPRAWCVEKAILCCAVLRALDIPAALGFGIVKNHIGTEKLTAYLRREEIVFHGFVEVFLDDRWSKCTPAFDRRICRLNRVDPLEWNGVEDSLFQAYRSDEQFMEYLHFYGSFADVPLELMHSEMFRYYPHLFFEPVDTPDFSFRFDREFLPGG